MPDLATATYSTLVRLGRELIAEENAPDFKWRWGDLAIAAVAYVGSGSGRIISVDTCELIRSLHAGGMNINAIATKLNVDGAPSARGTRWTHKTVEHVVRYPSLPRAQVNERLDDFARKTGFYESGRSLSSLRLYRDVAQKWPLQKRVVGVSWAAHRQMGANPERFDLLKPGMVSTTAGDVRRRFNLSNRAYLPGIDRVIAALRSEDFAREVCTDRAVADLLRRVLAVDEVHSRRSVFGRLRRVA